jgi:diguanylate cyclase (GGDEF)-like protein/PAS domain S-box-containing protein
MDNQVAGVDQPAPIARGTGAGELRAAFDDAPVGMALLALDGRVLHANGALGRMLRLPPHHLKATDLQAFAHPDDANVALIPLRLIATGEVRTYQVERRIVRRDGSSRWAQFSVSMARDEAGNPAYVVVHAQDVTERKEREDRLRHRALHDPLTGLPNRALFAERLGRALAEGVERSAQISVLLLDLDGFKAVNDRLGHDAGDRVLAVVGRRLVACLRPGDVAARFGGDEFALLVERTRGGADAIAVAERVLTSLHAPIPIGDVKATISAGIGIARPTTGTTRPGDLLRDADNALYRAKSAGPGSYAVYAVESFALDSPIT